MREFAACIIGGGASGLVGAISAKRSGKDCVILEKMPSVGKKILASGNGRCNLLNENLDESCYNPASRALVKKMLASFGKHKIIDFFKSVGVYTKNEGDRIFPATNQAATVLRALVLETERLAIPVELNFNVSKITHSNGRFLITAKSGVKILCRYLLLTGGGRSYPALGSDGSAYKLAAELGHRIIEPIPSAVPIVVKSQIIHLLQGQRIAARAKSIIDGKVTESSEGELLFAKYGLSGTAILDISRSISVALNRKLTDNVEVSIDAVPFMTESDLNNELSLRAAKKYSNDDFLLGILPNKFSRVLRQPKAADLKDLRFKVNATRSWNEAEFTAGGVSTDEVCDYTLESKLVKGLYFAGEILDVDGKRGGYNLAWAWASGAVAGGFN